MSVAGLSRPAAGTFERSTWASGFHAAAVCGTLMSLAWKPLATTSALLLVACGAVAILGMRALRLPVLPRVRLGSAVAAGAVGIAAFAVVRVAVDGFGVRLPAIGIAAIVLAGLAEEAFFRGYLDGIARRAGFGAVATAATTTVLFAIVHVPSYGVWILPLDLAAGALFAWQREATGTWTVPAATHAVANLFQLG